MLEFIITLLSFAVMATIGFLYGLYSERKRSKEQEYLDDLLTLLNFLTEINTVTEKVARSATYTSQMATSGASGEKGAYYTAYSEGKSDAVRQISSTLLAVPELHVDTKTRYNRSKYLEDITKRDTSG